MTRSAATKAIAAADALLEWLRSQPSPAVFRGRAPPDPAPGDPGAGGPDAPSDAAARRHQAAPADADSGRDRAPAAPASATPAAFDAGAKNGGGPPLRLAHTDWLHHRLLITGPAAALAAFRTAAAGAGVIPWQLNRDRLEEDLFHLLAAPPPQQQRSLSLAGARIVAGQLRAAVTRRHDLAVSRVGHSRACPFDLHALVPVPEAILRCGPDDAVSVQWLWQHWGTTRALRHVTADTAVSQDRPRQPAAGEAVFVVHFWSADWSPWRALAAVGGRFPAVRFDLRPSYDAP